MSVPDRVVDPYELAQRVLDRFYYLPENWDGDRAPQPSKDAVRRALEIVGILRPPSYEIPAPHVAAMPDGSVKLTWVRVTRSGRLEIEARIQDEGDELMMGYTHAPGFDVFEGPLTQKDPRLLAERVQRLLKDVSK